MNELHEALERALPDIARRMQNELRLVAPVDTGHLRRTIKVKPTNEGLIIFLVEYAMFVEFGCFFKDTILINTKKGNKKLKDLKTGELIWTGKDYKKLIQKEKLEIGYPIKKIRIRTKNKTLEVTEDHPIWTTKGWKKARDLKKSDKIKKYGYGKNTRKQFEEFTLEKIESIKKIEMNKSVVYNISLEGDSSFFANGILTHNTPPHIIRPKNKKALKFKVGKKVILTKQVRHPGTRPNPFIRNTIQNKLANIIKEELLK